MALLAAMVAGAGVLITHRDGPSRSTGAQPVSNGVPTRYQPPSSFPGRPGATAPPPANPGRDARPGRRQTTPAMVVQVDEPKVVEVQKIGGAPLASRPALAAQRLVAPSATIRCVASCTTSATTLSMSGDVAGKLAPGHTLSLFVRGPDARYHPGSREVPDGDRWSGTAPVGSANGTDDGYSYQVCVYDIDATFADDLDARGVEELDRGLAQVPTTGSAQELACRAVRWDRP